jgi:AcrR family transcriptional regulator
MVVSAGRTARSSHVDAVNIEVLVDGVNTQYRPDVTGPAHVEGSTKEAVIRAAIELRRERGVEGITLRAVGERVGVSRGTPYRHFADKSDLLAAVAGRDFTELRHLIQEAAQGAGPDPVEQVRSILRSYLGFALADTGRYRLMFGPGLTDRAHPALEVEAEQTFATFAGYVRAATPPARDSVRLAATLWAAVHGIADLALAGHAKPAKGLGDPLALAADLVDMFTCGR